MLPNEYDLLKEAYKLWNISDSKIIYDFPKVKRENKHSKALTFMINYGDDLDSWPRSYAIALPDGDLQLRVIMPIIVLKDYEVFTIETPAWYDMPVELHDKIVNLVEHSQIRIKLSWWKRIFNRIFPVKFSDIIPVQSYKFAVSYNNDDELNVSLVKYQTA